MEIRRKKRRLRLDAAAAKATGEDLVQTLVRNGQAQRNETLLAFLGWQLHAKNTAEKGQVVL